MSNKAHHNSGAADAAAKTYTINHTTSAEAKEEIVRAALAGPERVVTIEAAAGTGKGHLLRALASQPGVQICAPTAAAVRHLAADGIKARTPDELLSYPGSQLGIKVLVVTQAGDSTLATVTMINDVTAALGRNGGGEGSNDAFWSVSASKLIRHPIDLCKLGRFAEIPKLILFP